jgi:hypothetical protein
MIVPTVRSQQTEHAMATVAPEQFERPTNWIEPDGLYEVIDGRVVEKTMGAYECWLAALLFGALDTYLKANPVGRAVQEMIFDLRPVAEREP